MTNQLRRTKIVATMGPAIDSPEMLERVIRAGVDLFRANFSHGSAEDHQRRIENARAMAKRCGRVVGILADLQGPKIRVSRFKNSKITLQSGQAFILDATLDKESGDEKSVGIDYKALPQDVHAGDTLLLDDGLIVLTVDKVDGQKIMCTVKEGGVLSNNKGINRMGGGLSAKALTDKDRADIITAAKLNVDYVAVSFPRSAADIEEARDLLKAAGSKAGIVAKIERTEAVKAIDEIIKASEAVMVARGDLAVEVGDAEVPAIQKMIIQRARALDTAVITATQMMESMIHNPIPTRAEVSDVANAVLDGTDAVMLSAETATGEHPDKVVASMDRICRSAERSRTTQISGHRVECQFKHVDEAIAMATMYTANHLNIKAIIALTESGATPLWMSRIRSGISVFGLSRSEFTQRKMTLFRGVYPIHFDFTEVEWADINRLAVSELEKLGIVKNGDLVILTKGDKIGLNGGTNAMKILEVGKIA